MKLRTILFIFFGLGVAVVLGNSIAGSVIADRIDEQLKSSPALRDSGYEISYDKLSVNPLLAQILVEGLSVINKFDASKVRAKSLHGSLAYGDLFAYDAAAQTWRLSSLKLDCDSLDLGLSFLPQHYLAEHLTLDFDGMLTQENVGLDADFPQKKQTLKLKAQNISVNDASSPQAAKWVFAVVQAVSEAKTASGEIIWNPAENKIEMRAIHAESEHMTFDYAGEIEYRGSSPVTYQRQRLSDSFNAVFAEPGVTLTPPHGGGSYYAESGTIQGKLSRRFNKSGRIGGLPEGELSAKLENLRIMLPGHVRDRMKQQMLLTILRLNSDEIPVQSADIEYRREGERMTLENTTLALKFFTARLNAIARVDDEVLAASQITQGKLALSQLTGTLKGAIKMYESLSGNKLPRENDAIFFPITGTLGQPKLKGLPF